MTDEEFSRLAQGDLVRSDLYPDLLYIVHSSCGANRKIAVTASTTSAYFMEKWTRTIGHGRGKKDFIFSNEIESGDVIRRRNPSGVSYIAHTDPDCRGPAALVRVVEMTNPTEWTLIRKCSYGEKNREDRKNSDVR